MEVKVNYLDKMRFEIEAGQHKIVCDQPVENGGDGTGMNPPELLLASLGSCAAYYAVEYLKRHKLPTAGAAVRVTAEKMKAPARLGAFHVHLHCPAVLNAEQLEGLTRAVHLCLVHNTLVSLPNIEFDIEAARQELLPAPATAA